MEDSKAVASVRLNDNNKYTLYLRGDFMENLGIYSFWSYRKQFKSEVEAITFFKRSYAQGCIVPFDQLPLLSAPIDI